MVPFTFMQQLSPKECKHTQPWYAEIYCRRNFLALQHLQGGDRGWGARSHVTVFANGEKSIVSIAKEKQPYKHNSLNVCFFVVDLLP